MVENLPLLTKIEKVKKIISQSQLYYWKLQQSNFFGKEIATKASDHFLKFRKQGQ